jgi:two-component system LytT family sensor kinase
MWKASTLYWIVQLLGWALFCILLGITRYSIGEFDKAIIFQLIELYILLVLVTHFMRFVLLKFDWINLRLRSMIPRVIILNYGTALLLISITITLGFMRKEATNIKWIELFINSLVYTLFFMLWTAIYLSNHLIQKSRTQELNNLQLTASHQEIELKTLREQLNPHFLFNSLNSIRALVEIEPQIAKNAITTLSTLLRNSLQMGKKTKVSLKDEITLVEEYLKLEKIRFEERLDYSIIIDVRNETLIPPFIIQTLVENAIKHGIAKSKEGGSINVHIFQQMNKLFISVKNTGHFGPKNTNGIGLENTKRRLKLQYGENAQLHIQELNNEVEAKITILNID